MNRSHSAPRPEWVTSYQASTTPGLQQDNLLVTEAALLMAAGSVWTYGYTPGASISLLTLDALGI